MHRLRDLESPEPSTSATPITQATHSSQRRNINQPQRQTKPLPQSATTQRDKPTVMARQRSAPDRKRESAEEAKLREAVMSEVLDLKPSESWDDIAGLAGAKQVTPSRALCNTYTSQVVCEGDHMVRLAGHTYYTHFYNCFAKAGLMKLHCSTGAHTADATASMIQLV